MNKGSIIRLVVAFCVLALGTGIVVGGKLGMSTVGATDTNEQGIYQFKDMHMHNIYKSDEYVLNEQKLTDKTFEIFVSDEYAGDDIYAVITDTEGNFVEKLYFTRTRDDLMTTSDGQDIKGAIYSLSIAKQAGYVCKVKFYNDNNEDRIIDFNNTDGYELVF